MLIKILATMWKSETRENYVPRWRFCIIVSKIIPAFKNQILIIEEALDDSHNIEIHVIIDLVHCKKDFRVHSNRSSIFRLK